MRAHSVRGSESPNTALYVRVVSTYVATYLPHHHAHPTSMNRIRIPPPSSPRATSKTSRQGAQRCNRGNGLRHEFNGIGYTYIPLGSSPSRRSRLIQRVVAEHLCPTPSLGASSNSLGVDPPPRRVVHGSPAGDGSRWSTLVVTGSSTRRPPLSRRREILAPRLLWPTI